MSMEWGGESLPNLRPSQNIKPTPRRKKKKKMTTEPIGTFTTSAVNLLPGDVVRVNIAPSPLVTPDYVWWEIHHTEVEQPNLVRIYYIKDTTIIHTVLWHCQVTCRLEMSK